LYFGSNRGQRLPANVGELLLIDEKLVAHYTTHLFVNGIGDSLFEREEDSEFI